MCSNLVSDLKITVCNCSYVCSNIISRWLSHKESPASARDVGWIPGWGRSPGEEDGNLFQCSCLENPMDRGAWRVTVQGVADHKRSEHDLSTKQQQRINKRDSPLRDALALSPCEDRVRRRQLWTRKRRSPRCGRAALWCWTFQPTKLG